LENFTKLSQSISSEIESYKHCAYQSAVAGIIVNTNKKFMIVTMPTGSGKTWIQGVIAKYYCSLGKSVAIIEPSDELRI
jgi:superfamily II DNA or RNA helicase